MAKLPYVEEIKFSRISNKYLLPKKFLLRFSFFFQNDKKISSFFLRNLFCNLQDSIFKKFYEKNLFSN